MNYVTNYVPPHEKKAKKWESILVLPSAMKMDYPGHTVVTEKHWFSVSLWYQGRPITQCETKDVAACSREGGSLMAIQTNDPKITARG